MKAFKDIAPCSLVEVDRRFREAYCLHHRDDAGGTDLWNVGLYIPEGYSLQNVHYLRHVFNLSGHVTGTDLDAINRHATFGHVVLILVKFTYFMRYLT
jgi:hypothetical protein